VRIDITMLNKVEFYGPTDRPNPFINYDETDPVKYKDMFKAPTTFEEAWNHLCPRQRKRWRGGIGKENSKMKENEVKLVMDQSKMEPGRACTKHKWVFEIKRDGTFRARLVACGYSKKTEVDFQESYSPVINDVVFRILIVLHIIWGLTAALLDVEVAFLNGELDEKIYMECPEGMVRQKNDVVPLLKPMYGLVQAARQFFVNFCKILKKVGFEPNKSEPCFFHKKVGDHMVLMAIHVDDCYVIGKP
jgi:Reverse transcriptase (RNA-dependent DNA polymerase)